MMFLEVTNFVKSQGTKGGVEYNDGHELIVRWNSGENATYKFFGEDGWVLVDGEQPIEAKRMNSRQFAEAVGIVE